MIPQFLTTLLQRPQLAKAFWDASRVLKKVETDLQKDLQDLGSHHKNFLFPHLELGQAAYFQRNFFSILFVTIYQSLEIEDSRVYHYTRLLHLIRGVVTSTDNIIDKENKGALLVSLGHGEVLPQILSLIVQQGEWFSSLQALSPSAAVQRQCYGALLDALWALGEEEAGEEGVVKEVYSPEKIIREIHEFRGAQLLLLAFVVPHVVEKHMATKMDLAMMGVRKIGLSLQILDDVCDLAQDLESGNHNYLLSVIVHEYADGAISRTSVSHIHELHMHDPARSFPDATLATLKTALGFAYEGFSFLEKSGHPLDQAGARKLLEAMFELRGLKNLWDFAHKDQNQKAQEYTPGP